MDGEFISLTPTDIFVEENNLTDENENESDEESDGLYSLYECGSDLDD